MMRKTRYLRATVMAFVLLLALTGCVKLDMDMNVRANNTVDGTLIVAVDKAVLPVAGRTEAEILQQLETQGPLAGSNRPKHGTVTEKPYDAGGKIGRVYAFTNVPLSEFGGANNGLSITRRSDRFFVVGVVDMTTDMPTDPQEKATVERLSKTAETRIRMTFPGEVLKSNGKIDGRSVTWHPKIGERTELTAEARTTAIIPILLAVVGAAAVLLIVLALIILLLVRRRRRRTVAYEGYEDHDYNAVGYRGDGYYEPPARPYQPSAPPYQPAQPPGPPYRPPGAYPGGAQQPGHPPADPTQPLPRVDPPPTFRS